MVTNLSTGYFSTNLALHRVTRKPPDYTVYSIDELQLGIADFSVTVSTIDVCFSVDDKYANQGKLGAAVIGSHSACDVSI